MTTVAVIGAGVMGRGIIQWAAQAGAEVIAYDVAEGAARDARAFVADVLSRSVAKGRMREDERAAIVGRIGIAEGIEGLRRADFVIEAIVESLAAKRAIFAELEQIVRDDAVLCTNTSSLSVTACARDCRVPGRVAGLHFFNPVPLMKVVEVVRGERTRSDTIESLLALVRSSSHQPVVSSDTPGFVVNHAGRGLHTEGLRIIEEGVAGFADVDRVMRDAVGLRMGPFELLDLTGLDVSGVVLREIYEAFFQDPRYRPNPLVYRRMDAGLLGRKTSEGFYRYADGKKLEPPEAEAPPARSVRLHLDAGGGAGAEMISAALRKGGATLVGEASDAEVVVCCPLGDDLTTAALAAGHDPRRTVGIDPFFADRLADGGRATIMATPVTDPQAIDAVHGVLAQASVRVTRICDSPGFIAQRVVANIVNTACEIAQRGIATPADIELGVTLGLGYPRGPFAMGDAIGGRRILHILERLQAITGDPRYRPSLWLRRRAQLAVSLATPERRSGVGP